MNMIFNLLIDFANASSSGHGGGHDEGIPTIVYYQAINVSIFIGILYWFGKDKVREFFSARLSEFHRLALETEQARKNLEHKKLDLVRRSQQLQATSAQSLVEAKSEAEKMYLGEIEKSKQQAQKVAKDVEAQILTEQQKMIETLRQEALEMSVASAEQQLKGLDSGEKQKVAQNVQKRIEGASR
jgi:F-type H+-transporting ATPase subunit b